LNFHIKRTYKDLAVSSGQLAVGRPPTATILGVLGVFRQELPHCRHLLVQGEAEAEEGENSGSLSTSLLGLYRLCAGRYIAHPDHNVINAALETLQSLLRHAPPLVADALSSPGGVAAQADLPGELGAEEEEGAIQQTKAAALPTGNK
jgi:hypothetical protein